MARRKKGETEKRDERLNLRLTVAEKSEIHAAAEACGLRPTEYARRRTLGLRIMAAVRADPALVIELNRIGVNINQIARAFNSGAAIPLPKLDQLIDRLNAALDAMQNISDQDGEAATA